MITPYLHDDPVLLAKDYVKEEASSAWNHQSQAITSAVRFVLWTGAYFALSTAKLLNVLDDKWMERRTRKVSA